MKEQRREKATAPPPHIWWRANSVLSGCATDVVECGALSQHVRAEEKKERGKKENVGPTLLFAGACSTYGGRNI